MHLQFNYDIIYVYIYLLYIFMETDDINKKVDTSNIFDDFTDDIKLKEEIKVLVENQQRDIFYYIQKIKRFLQFFIVLLTIFISISYWYIYIQNSENYNNSSLIDPICFFILWDIVNTNTYCSSVSSLYKQYSTKLDSLKNIQNNNITSIFENVYKVENFLESKEVIFLKNKTDSKIDITWILISFDSLLTNFESTEKEKLKCYNMEIYSDNKIKFTCDAYSSWFDKTIKWFDWTTNVLVWWSSISYANSFINFIKTQSNNFSIINEQKIFNSTPLLLEKNWFTDKTNFNLELQYNSNNIIF